MSYRQPVHFDMSRQMSAASILSAGKPKKKYIIKENWYNDQDIGSGRKVQNNAEYLYDAPLTTIYPPTFKKKKKKTFNENKDDQPITYSYAKPQTPLKKKEIKKNRLNRTYKNTLNTIIEDILEEEMEKELVEMAEVQLKSEPPQKYSKKPKKKSRKFTTIHEENDDDLDIFDDVNDISTAVQHELAKINNDRRLPRSIFTNRHQPLSINSLNKPNVLEEFIFDSILEKLMHSKNNNNNKENDLQNIIDEKLAEIMISQMIDIDLAIKRTLNNYPARKYHTKQFGEIALEVCISELIEALDEDMKDLFAFEKTIIPPS
ncbi:hypothetical protein SNEBB_009955 [Seison nebaliae]|nr:hypothetical protein SNEBB_009955 [Seison nebaliae]